MILSGALLLGFGYSVMIPFYEAGKIPRLQATGHLHGAPTMPMVGHVLKMVAMNGGWCVFGLGLALHAKVFSPSPSRRKLIPTLKPQEHVA